MAHARTDDNKRQDARSFEPRCRQARDSERSNALIFVGCRRRRARRRILSFGAYSIDRRRRSFAHKRRAAALHAAAVSLKILVRVNCEHAAAERAD